MARRRLALLLALTLGFIAVPGVSGGGTGLDDPPAAAEPVDAAPIDEPGAHLHVPISTPRCVACERVARGVVRAVAVLDGFDDDDEELTEAENARRASRRRRGFHGRSEAAIDAALDAVCETLARSRVVKDANGDDDANGGATASCETTLARHRGEIADRVFVMRHGELVESGDAASLFAAPRDAYTRDLIASQPEGIRPPESKEGAPLLTAQGIKVHFPIRRGLLRRTTDWIRAVDGVGLELHSGRTLGIVGESGSGKSTLARAITKLVDHEGEVTIDGTVVNAQSASRLKEFRRDVQIVFQDPFGALSPRMSVGDIIAEGLVAHDIGTAEERSKAVAEVLREVGLDPEVAGRYPHEFSGGQRQRIAIARALVLRPRVILFDEPTSALDMTVQKTLIQLLQDLQARYGIGYVFISHDIALIASISHEMLVMKDGLVVEQGTAEAIMTSPREDYTRDLITAARRKG